MTGLARQMARDLVDGARAELELTPKPGLVDLRDNGSHPDLSFERMSRSIDLLPQYYDELIAIAASKPQPDPAALDLDACIAAARRAEARMAAAIGSNAHRGYIFLSGLVLLASAGSPQNPARWRRAIAGLAAGILVRLGAAPAATHGAELRQRLHVGGIHAEALAGLPSVFEHGLPALERGVAGRVPAAAARHYAMAALMASVEDTTALHRCGRDGLDRLRRDGHRLQRLMEQGGDYLAELAAMNDAYRAMRLTMGGVADCLALTLAIARRARRGRE